MKKFIVGLVLGLCIGLPVSVMADSMIGKKIETEVAIKLDGEYLPINAIGLEGKTYAPVRALAEALGKEVDWDGEVIIKTPFKEGDKLESVEEQWTLERVELEMKRVEYTIHAHKAYIDNHKSDLNLTDAMKQSLVEAQRIIEENLNRLEELKKIRDELINNNSK